MGDTAAQLLHGSGKHSSWIQLPEQLQGFNSIIRPVLKEVTEASWAMLGEMSLSIH